MFNLARISILLSLSALLCASCTTSRVVGDTGKPQVEVESSGIIWVGERQVEIGKIGKALRSAGFKKGEAIKVLVRDKSNRALMRAISSDLVMSGYMRPVFITTKITGSTTGAR